MMLTRVVYADERAVGVRRDDRRGPLQFSSHVAYPRYPTIADVDNDGSAEIIIVNGEDSCRSSSNRSSRFGCDHQLVPLRVRFGISMLISLPMSTMT